MLPDDEDVIRWLFACDTADEFSARFVTLPTETRTLLVAVVRDLLASTEDEEAREVMGAQLRVLESATNQLDVSNAWIEWRERLDRIWSQFVVRVQARESAVVAAREAADWTALRAAGEELLSEPVPPQLQMVGLSAIADSCIRDGSESRAQSLEIAIECWSQMDALLREAPEGWAEDEDRAQVLSNLGSALASRVMGDPQANRLAAISALSEAVELLGTTKSNLWAATLTNLGLALTEWAIQERRSSGAFRPITEPFEEAADEQAPFDDTDQAIETALSHYVSALTYRHPWRSASDWAYTKHNQGFALLHRRTGKAASNLRLAARCFRRARWGFGIAGQPDRWVGSTINLATAIWNGTRESPESWSSRQVLRLLDGALYRADERTQLFDRARGLFLRGRVHIARGAHLQGVSDLGSALEAARSAHESLLGVEIASHLANYHEQCEEWSDACDAWSVAVELDRVAGERHRIRSTRISHYGRLVSMHRWAAFSAAMADRPELAVEMIEAGRARELTRAVATESSEFEFIKANRPELAQRYEELESSLAQWDMTGAAASNEQIEWALDDLDSVLAQIRDVAGAERFLREPKYQSIASALEPDEALVYLLSTPYGSCVLVVRGPEPLVDHWTITELTSSESVAAYLGTDSGVQTTPGIFLARNLSASELSDALDIAQGIIAGRLLRSVSERLMGAGIHRLTMVPVGLLSFLPLWALSWTKGDAFRCLLDDFDVAVVPSAQLLIACRARDAKWRQQPSRTLLAVGDTSSDHPLEGARREVLDLAARWSGETMTLIGDEATKSNVLSLWRRADFVHLACHGSTSIFSEHFDAEVLLADGPLSVVDLFQTSRAPVRLVVASACETAVVQGAANVPDEVYSLSSALIVGGAAGCVATLWPVNDRATRLLMSRFYLELDDPTLSFDVARALRRAQLWLRDLTVDQIRELEGEASATSDRPDERPDSGKSRPYSSPVYWGAFVLTGR